MEEVWKDINLSSLHDQHYRSDHEFSVNTPINHTHHNAAAAANLRNIILQDFLSSSRDSTAPTDTSALFSTAVTTASASSQPPPRPPPPATALSLNSSRELHFLDNPNGHFRADNSHFISHCQPISNTSFQSPFDQVLGPPPSFGKKRVQDSDSTTTNNNNNNTGDRRHKRMIKNRESAARSRARKQAYTNELEIEVAHLMEENAKLRRQQEQLRIGITTAAQVPKNHRLHRTSTAPF